MLASLNALPRHGVRVYAMHTTMNVKLWIASVWCAEEFRMYIIGIALAAATSAIPKSNTIDWHRIWDPYNILKNCVEYVRTIRWVFFSSTLSSSLSLSFSCTLFLLCIHQRCTLRCPLLTEQFSNKFPVQIGWFRDTFFFFFAFHHWLNVPTKIRW